MTNNWLSSSSAISVIAGPCSAESREQVLKTARALASGGQLLAMRAGVWKPRTRPGHFEGRGEKALEWLQEARRETGLRMAVEVATPYHIEKCMEYGIDMLWIGARTSVNPFSVQEIAAALKGTSLSVLVKNPVNPDVDLWMGVIERIQQAGIREIAAVHRGFSTMHAGVYRNLPLWEIPVELRRRMPSLPMLCDPSHISGSPEFLLSVSQHALDLNMQGLMIEVHIDPASALSDARQQITPEGLMQLLKKLIVRQSDPRAADVCQQLEKLRSQIDDIDQHILELLSRRMKTTEKIGHLKKENQLTILQLKRWTRLVQDRLNQGEKLELDSEFLKKLLELVHQESIRLQQQIMAAGSYKPASEDKDAARSY